MLADKLVEYRNDEDSIRTALLSAQRLGDTVVREANHKAGLILDDANIKAQKIEETAKRKIVDEERELERVKRRSLFQKPDDVDLPGAFVSDRHAPGGRGRFRNRRERDARRRAGGGAFRGGRAVTAGGGKYCPCGGSGSLGGAGSHRGSQSARYRGL